MKNRALALAMLIATPALAGPLTLDGHWVSAGPEKLGEIYGLRDFNFDGDAWSITFRAFGDAAQTVPIFTLKVAGQYKIGGTSETVPGAFEAIFGTPDKTLVADSQIAVEMFAKMGCTLQVGTPLDLTDAPCGFLPSVMESAVEYDLVSLQGAQLFLGDRTNDLSKARPTALSAYALVRN